MKKEEVNEKREVVKEALKREYLKEIAKELGVRAKVDFEEDIRVDDKEMKLIFDNVELTNDKLIGLVRHLADRLADTEAELWLQKELTKTKTEG